MLDKRHSVNEKFSSFLSISGLQKAQNFCITLPKSVRERVRNTRQDQSY